MARVIWAEKAVSDLERIYDFIAADSPFYARAQTQKILKAAAQLQKHPVSGRFVPEFPNSSHRELIVGSYRVIHRYQRDSDTVFIVTVVHSARLLQEDSLL